MNFNLGIWDIEPTQGDNLDVASVTWLVHMPQRNLIYNWSLSLWNLDVQEVSFDCICLGRLDMMILYMNCSNPQKIYFHFSLLQQVPLPQHLLMLTIPRFVWLIKQILFFWVWALVWAGWVKPLVCNSHPNTVKK